jgi:hypothetical protein
MISHVKNLLSNTDGGHYFVLFLTAQLIAFTVNFILFMSFNRDVMELFLFMTTNIMLVFLMGYFARPFPPESTKEKESEEKTDLQI